MISTSASALLQRWSLKKIIAYGAVWLAFQQLSVLVLFSVGVNLTAPFQVNDGKVLMMSPSSFQQRNFMTLRQQTSATRLAAFDDLQFSNKTHISKTWRMFDDDQELVKEQVDSNTCFPQRTSGAFSPVRSASGSSSVKCLPAFFIVGFEKCGTTALNIWLSYHPNLHTNWLESRFFDRNSVLEHMDADWHEYTQKQLPSIPSSGIGQYWTFEKSPAYATKPIAPIGLSEVVPNARFLFLVRNPTLRAYSMFLMYTHHYPSVTNALRAKPVSFFVKNLRTGDVRYIRDDMFIENIPPGVGGTEVAAEYYPTPRQEDDQWRYVGYPPSPEDFHNLIRRLLVSQKSPDLDNQSRELRICTGGLYAEHLQQHWLSRFSPEQFIIVPAEDFFDSTNAVEHMSQLQQMLGLPSMDYSKLLYMDPATGRVDIPSSIGSILNQQLNSYDDHGPMLETTKHILDDYYCESNRKLSNMLGGRRLSGYACADSTLTTQTMTTATPFATHDRAQIMV